MMALFQGSSTAMIFVDLLQLISAHAAGNAAAKAPV
jgi:hypothetical protein